MNTAYLCSETSLFDDFDTNTFKNILKYVKQTRVKNTIKHDTFHACAKNGGYPLFFALLHGKKHSPLPVVGWLAGCVGGLAGWVGWAGWLDWLAGLAGWAGGLGWLAALAGWAGWVGWLGWLGWLAGLAG